MVQAAGRSRACESAADFLLEAAPRDRTADPTQGDQPAFSKTRLLAQMRSVAAAVLANLRDSCGVSFFTDNLHRPVYFETG